MHEFNSQKILYTHWKHCPNSLDILLEAIYKNAFELQYFLNLCNHLDYEMMCLRCSRHQTVIERSGYQHPSFGLKTLTLPAYQDCVLQKNIKL